MTPTLSQKLTRFIWPILIAVAAMITFRPVFLDELTFDDVYQAGVIAPAHGPADLIAAAAQPWWPPDRGKHLWRPLPRLAIVLERTIDNAIGGDGTHTTSRAASLLLHTANALLAFAFARMIGFTALQAGIAALVLAVHPMRSEAVHQIAGQAELLTSAIMLAGLIHWLWSRRAGRPWNEIAAVQAAIFFLALGSKEHALLYPLFVALLAFGRRRHEPLPPARAWITGGAAFCGTLALYLLGRYLVTGGLMEPISSIPDYENPMARMSLFGGWEAPSRLASSAQILAYTISKFLVPVGLAPDFSADSLPVTYGWSQPLAWLGAVAAATLLAHFVMERRRGHDGWIIALAGFLAWLLTSNLFLTTGTIMAGRLWYFPMTAAALGVGWELGKRNHLRWLPLAVAAYALLLMSASWNHSRAWRSDFEFSLATLRQFPYSWRGNHNLAREFMLRGDYRGGYTAARHALEVQPENPRTWDLLAQIDCMIPGQEAEADEAFRRVFKYDPNLFLAHQHYANFLLAHGRNAKAAEHLQKLLDLNPPPGDLTEQAVADVKRKAAEKLAALK